MKRPATFLAAAIYLGGAIIGGSAAIERFFGRESPQPSALGIAGDALIRIPGLETVGRAIQSVTAYATAWREQPTAVPAIILPFLRRGKGLVYTDELAHHKTRLQEERATVPFPEEVWAPGVLIHEDIIWLNATIQGLAATSAAVPEVLRVKDLAADLLRRLNGATARYHRSLLHHALYGRLEANVEGLIAAARAEALRKAMYADVYSEAALMAAFQAELGRRGLAAGFGAVEMGALMDGLRAYGLEVAPRDTGAALAALMEWLLQRKKAYATAADVDRRLKELGEALHVRIAGATGVFLRVLLSYSALGVLLEWLVRSQEQVFVLNVPSLASPGRLLEDVSRVPTSMLTTRERDACL
jgi:hypothetical protein